MTRVAAAIAAIAAIATSAWAFTHRRSPAVQGWEPPCLQIRRHGALNYGRTGPYAGIVLLHGLVATGDIFGSTPKLLGDRASRDRPRPPRLRPFARRTSHRLLYHRSHRRPRRPDRPRTRRPYDLHRRALPWAVPSPCVRRPPTQTEPTASSASAHRSGPTPAAPRLPSADSARWASRWSSTVASPERCARSTADTGPSPAFSPPPSHHDGRSPSPARPASTRGLPTSPRLKTRSSTAHGVS